MGNLVVFLGAAMGAGLAGTGAGTSEPVFGEDQFLWPGAIIPKVPMS